MESFSVMVINIFGFQFPSLVVEVFSCWTQPTLHPMKIKPRQIWEGCLLLYVHILIQELEKHPAAFSTLQTLPC